MAEDIERAVQTYWQISKGYERSVDTGITTEQALQTLGRYAGTLNPQRRVSWHICDLQKAIIHGDARFYLAKQPATPLDFVSRSQA